MPYVTITLRRDVANRLGTRRTLPEKDYSDAVDRLLDNQPAKSVREWMESLTALEGRSLFTAAGDARG